MRAAHVAGRRKTIDNPFAWSAKQERAALLLAEGALTQQQVADVVGVTRQTVSKWLQQPEYTKHIAGLQHAMYERMLQIGIANKEARIVGMVGRHRRMQDVIAERAAGTREPVPGGRSGLLVRQRKMIGSGDGSTIVTEYAFDSALAREMRELEKQIAQETGQLGTGVQVEATSGDVRIVVTYANDQPDAS